MSHEFHPSLHWSQRSFRLPSGKTASRFSVSLSRIQRLRQASFTSKSSLATSSVSPIFGQLKTASHRSQRFVKYRTALCRISGINSLITAVVEALACVVISRPPSEAELQWTAATSLIYCICMLSFLQIPLIFSYWSLTLRYEDTLQSLLNNHYSPIPQLQISRQRSLILCLLECALHLVVMYPEEDLWVGSHFLGQEVRLYDLIFIAILMRGYHFGRFAYWSGAAASLRTQFFIDLFDLHTWFRYNFKANIHKHGLSFLILIYASCTLLLVLVEYTFEEALSDREAFEGLENAVVTVLMASTSVGFSEKTPKTALGRLIAMISAMCACALFGLVVAYFSHSSRFTSRENGLFHEILFVRYKSQHRDDAAVLIQRWWKLTLSKRKSASNKYDAISFKSQQKAYKRILNHHRKEYADFVTEKIAVIEKPLRELFSYSRDQLKGSYSLLSVVSAIQLNKIVRKEYRNWVVSRQIANMPVKSNQPQPRSTAVKCRKLRLSTIAEEASEIGSPCPGILHNEGFYGLPK